MRRSSNIWPAAALAVYVGVAPGAVAAGSSPPAFDRIELSSDNGSAQLAWTDLGARYEVELARAGDPPRTIYTGSIPSAHISGLVDGQYEARVRVADAPGAWSAPARIAVMHHPMGSVWLLLAMGGLTFLGTAAFLYAADRRNAA